MNIFLKYFFFILIVSFQFLVSFTLAKDNSPSSSIYNGRCNADNCDVIAGSLYWGLSSYQYNHTAGFYYKPNTEDTFDKIDLYLFKNGNPTDDVYVEIWDRNIGSIIASSSTVPAANIKSGSATPYYCLDISDCESYRVTFTFSDPVTLNASSTQGYTIKFRRTGQDDDINHYTSFRANGDFDGYITQSGLGNVELGSQLVFLGSLGDGVFKTWNTKDGENCCSNILFLPGIEGSRLYDEIENKRWEATSSEIPNLYLDNDGKSLDQTIHTKDIIDKAFSLSPIYNSFIKKMDSLVSDGVINMWKPEPYDWRYSPTDIIKDGISYLDHTVDLKNEIETLASTSRTGKVTIIAHSNGGLVTKALVQQLNQEGKSDLVDKIIFVGVPQLGTPDALQATLHGTELGAGFILDKSTTRKFAENMPGAYGLLPSTEYFNYKGSFIYFDPSTDRIGPFFTVYGDSIGNSTELTDFLLGKEGRQKPDDTDLHTPNILNSSILTKAEDEHSLLDTWEVPTGINLIQIAGWGKDTLYGMRYSLKYPCTELLVQLATCAPYLDENPLYTRKGDSTVIEESALSSNGDKYYLNLLQEKSVSHRNLLESPNLLSFIEKIIKKEDVVNDAHITTTQPSLSYVGKTKRISVHSPVSIDLYDNAGNHTGLVENIVSDIKQYEEQVPESSYFESTDGKYIELNPLINSSVVLKGTGIGTFTFVVETLNEDDIETVDTFSDIPVTPMLTAEYIPTQNGTVILQVDVNGDGVQDFSISTSEDKDPVLFFQILKMTISALSLDHSIEQQVQQKINKAIKIITKNKEKQITAYIKQFSRSVELKKWQNSKKITDEQKQALIEMVNRLLDQIN